MCHPRGPVNEIGRDCSHRTRLSETGQGAFWLARLSQDRPASVQRFSRHRAVEGLVSSTELSYFVDFSRLFFSSCVGTKYACCFQSRRHHLAPGGGSGREEIAFPSIAGSNIDRDRRVDDARGRLVLLWVRDRLDSEGRSEDASRDLSRSCAPSVRSFLSLRRVSPFLQPLLSLCAHPGERSTGEAE